MWSSTSRQFRRWADSGIWDVILDALAGSGACAALQMVGARLSGRTTVLTAERGSRAQRVRPFARAATQSRSTLAPTRLAITPGQAHDLTAFPALMQEVDCDPKRLLGDKG